MELEKISVPWVADYCQYAKYIPGEVEVMPGRATVQQRGGLYCTRSYSPRSGSYSHTLRPCTPNLAECPRMQPLHNVVCPQCEERGVIFQDLETDELFCIECGK